MYAARENSPPRHPATYADLSAVVTVSDDGGSSGRLRKELNLPAPGDVRNCIVASRKTRRCCRGSFNIASLPAKAWEDTISAIFFFRQ